MSMTPVAQVPLNPGPFEHTGSRHRTGALWRTRWAGWAFLTPVAIYLALFYAYPIARNLLMGFQNYTASSFVTGEAPYVGLSNYAAVVSSALFWPTIIRTALFTMASLAFQFAIGLALAVFFNSHFRLSALLRSLFLLPWLLPLIVSASTWKWMFDKDSGIVNFRHRGEYLDRGAVQHGDPLRRIAIDLSNPLRGGRFGWGGAVEEFHPDHIPAATPGVSRCAPSRACVHVESLRRDLGYNPRRPRELLEHAVHLVIPTVVWTSIAIRARRRS
jgi:hypothetical protein